MSLILHRLQALILDQSRIHHYHPMMIDTITKGSVNQRNKNEGKGRKPSELRRMKKLMKLIG